MATIRTIDNSASFNVQSISKGLAKYSHQLLLCNHFVNHISWPSIHFLKALLDLHKRRTTNWVMMPALLHQYSQDRWHVARNPRAFPASYIRRLNGVCNCLQYLLDALTCPYPIIVGIGLVGMLYMVVLCKIHTKLSSCLMF